MRRPTMTYAYIKNQYLYKYKYLLIADIKPVGNFSLSGTRVLVKCEFTYRYVGICDFSNFHFMTFHKSVKVNM